MIIGLNVTKEVVELSKEFCTILQLGMYIKVFKILNYYVNVNTNIGGLYSLLSLQSASLKLLFTLYNNIIPHVIIIIVIIIININNKI